MEFEEFKGIVMEGLQQIYGDSAEIYTDEVLRNNGTKYNGIRIILKDSKCRTAPIIEMDRIYKAYKNGGMDMGECIQGIYKQMEMLRIPYEAEQFAKGAIEWEKVKDNIYPLLLSTEENQEMLKNLVSTPMLDLSVVYIVRGKLQGERTGSMKISKGIFKHYGISIGRLHEQAMENLEKDGYRFRDMLTVVKEMMHMDMSEEEYDQICGSAPAMYVLTNRAGIYGAAGILNKKLIREFAGGRDFIILPSSVHETIFVPVTDKMDQGFCDGMVSEVNRTMVEAEERLTDHSYYYDAEADEIRMCA